MTRTYGMLAMAVAMVCLFGHATVGTPAIKTPTGTFLQLDGGNLAWTQKQWEEELGAMKRMGMDTLIIGTTVQDTYAFCKIKSYPLFDKCGTQDPLDTLLTISEKLGISVYLGFYSWDWTKQQTDEGFRVFADRCNLIADELWASYGKRKAFAGWYVLGWEIGNAPDEQNIGVRAYATVMTHLRTITPKTPIVMSPYFSLKVTPDDMEKGWTKLLTTLRPDVLAPQDGVGCDRGLTPDNVKPYFWAYSRAARKAGVDFWINVEVFDIPGGWKPATTDRVMRQLRAASPYCGKVIMFEYNHYLSPVRGLTGADALVKALEHND